MMREREQTVWCESVRKGKRHTSFVFWLVVLQDVFWWIWINFCYDDLLLEERRKEPPECRWSSPGEQCRRIMEFPVWGVPEYYSKNECLWKRKGKGGPLSKWWGYVGRNERVTNVCRTQMRNFKLNVKEETNNWKLEVKGYMVKVSWGEGLQ